MSTADFLARYRAEQAARVAALSPFERARLGIASDAFAGTTSHAVANATVNAALEGRAPGAFADVPESERGEFLYSAPVAEPAVIVNGVLIPGKRIRYAGGAPVVTPERRLSSRQLPFAGDREPEGNPDNDVEKAAKAREKRAAWIEANNRRRAALGYTLTFDAPETSRDTRTAMTHAEAANALPKTPEHVAERRAFPVMSREDRTQLATRTKNGPIPAGCRDRAGYRPNMEALRPDISERPGVFETVVPPNLHTCTSRSAVDAALRDMRPKGGKGKQQSTTKTYGVREPVIPNAQRPKSAETPIFSRGSGMSARRDGTRAERDLAAQNAAAADIARMHAVGVQAAAEEAMQATLVETGRAMLRAAIAERSDAHARGDVSAVTRAKKKIKHAEKIIKMQGGKL